ncbi:MAG: GAF domain-containing protein [Gemmatimonadetes bacterium]|nr:MAG: GAF domain-containing protein [Gemmatimonadota bacterium]
MALLIYTDEHGKEHQVPIERSKLLIGRSKDNDLALLDIYVSRYHAKITVESDRYYIEDCGSTYGTYVNGTQEKRVLLEYGDEIKVGETVLHFVSDEVEQTNEQLAQLVNKQNAGQAMKAFNQIEHEFDDIRDQLQAVRDSKAVDVTTLLERVDHLGQTIAEIHTNLAELEKASQINATLYEVGKMINTVFELNRLLNLVMDLALKVMNAERGFIMLIDQETGELRTEVARNMDPEDDQSLLQSESSGTSISQGIATQVIETGEPILTTDASNDPRFMRQASVIMYNIHSVICVPLRSKEQEIIGVIYVDNRISKGYFTQDDLDFLMAFTNQAALAIENAQLYNSIQEQERIRENLQRYLPAELANQMMNQGQIQLGGEECFVSILFSDIQGFTSRAEKMPAGEVVQMLNAYFSLMTDEIFKQEGTLDKFMGDGIMTIFGAPIPHEDHALRAIKAAIGMRERLKELNAEWAKEGKEPLVIRIGIASGTVVAGNIGSERRMDYTAIGDAVNLASRLESAASGGQILIDDMTYELAAGVIKANRLVPIRVKGKSRPIQVYEVVGLETDV